MELISKIEKIVKNGDEDDVWSFFVGLSCNESVFSIHSRHFSPMFLDKDVFFYATENEAVILFLDDYKQADRLPELADEEIIGKEYLPTYFTEKDNRLSPVYLMRLTANAFNESLARKYTVLPKVCCVLITTSYIINYDDMVRKWDAMNTLVCHKVKKLKCNLPVNTDNKLPGELMYRRYKNLMSIGLLNFRLTEAQTAGATAGAVRQEEETEMASLNIAPDTKAGTDAEEVEEEDDELDALVADFFNDDDDDDIVKKKRPAVRVLEPMKNPRRELDKLVGMKEVKQTITNLVEMGQYNAKLKSLNPKAHTHNLNLHAIFYGKVGVGKTTVGRLYGALLHQAGVLSRGHVVLANRGSFVGTLWGEEEKNVREIMKIAKGGVLLIDEAYLLATSSDKDPGRLVLPLLLDILSDEKQRDVAVVLCGYEQQMDGLLSTNQGLDSRFANRFYFPEFSLDELLKITKKRIAEYNYSFTAGAWRMYKHVLEQTYNSRDKQTWGNARSVANLLEIIYKKHAERCVRQNVEGPKLLKITADDIPLTVAPNKKPRIGFLTNYQQ